MAATVTADVIIVGGGLAGIAAAVRVAQAGRRVVLLESRKTLGGRAGSFVDPRTDEMLDNCQHAVMGCCTSLIDLYELLDVLQHIQWHDTIHWTAGGGVIDRLQPGRLPAPAHLWRSFRRLSFLSREERACVSRGLWRIIRLGAKGRLSWSDRSFAECLAELGQSESTIRKFWSLIITSACNLEPERVSASYAIQIFQDGLLANRFGYVIGLPRTPLRRLYDTVTPLIEAAGGKVRLGCPVRSLAFNGRRVTGAVTDDGVIEGSHLVAAVPFDRLGKLASETLVRTDQRLQQLDRFEFSPILGVHLWFDRRILDLPFLGLVDSPVHWLFDKGVDADGWQHVHAVVSAAVDWMDLDESDIVDRVMAEVHRLLPHAAGLAPQVVRAVKERRATFAAVPGVDGIRPLSSPGTVGLRGGGVRNLFLAGDWCDTGWPATMEGAVRSGYAAAAGLLQRDTMVGDLPPGIFSRLLGLRPAGAVAE